jgi:hypothetical protein
VDQGDLLWEQGYNAEVRDTEIFHTSHPKIGINASTLIILLSHSHGAYTGCVSIVIAKSKRSMACGAFKRGTS